MSRRGSRPARRRTPRPARARRVAIGGLLLCAAVAAIVYRPWRPIMLGRADPPVVARTRADIEPALRRRLDELTEIVRIHPYEPEPWARLGAAFEVHDLRAEAATCYARAARLDPDDGRWPYFLALALMPTDPVAALPPLERAALLPLALEPLAPGGSARIVPGPDYAPLQVHLGTLLLGAGHIDDAAGRYERAAALDPALAAAHIGRARIALARGDAAAAIADLDRALAAAPQSAEAHFVAAEAHRRAGDEGEAARHAALAGGRAKREDVPDVLRTQWQWPAGVTIFWRKVRSDRYLAEGMTDLAIAEWMAVLSDDPRSIRAWRELMHIYRGAGAGDLAIRAGGEVLAIDPAQASTRFEVGQLFLARGDIEHGLGELRRAAAAMADSAAAQLELAQALHRHGRRDEAIAVLESAQRRWPGDGDVARRLGELRGSAP
jgi:tetratricopeptide (TPR) repeat protein